MKSWTTRTLLIFAAVTAAATHAHAQAPAPAAAAPAPTTAAPAATTAPAAAAPAAPAPATTMPAAPAAPAPNAAGQSITLDEAVSLALSKNERAQVADLNDVVAEAAVEKARSGFLPVLSLSAQDQQHPERNGGTPPNVGTANIQFNQPVVNVPAWPLYSASKASLEAQRAQSIDDKRLLAFDAARSFLSVLNAEEILAAARKRLEGAQSDLNDTQARADAKLTSTNDVTRAQIALASALRELQTDKGTYDVAVVSLEFTLNAHVPQKLVLPQPMLDAAGRPLPGFTELIQTAVDKRPDVLSKKHALQAARDSASEPLLRIIPTLNLIGQANTSTNTPANAKVIDEFLGLSLSWTLYDAGSRYADKHSRDAQAQIADLTLVTLVRSVDEQVKAAAVTLIASQHALKAAELAVKSSQQSAEETEILYNQGLAKAIELVDAKDSVFLAETNYATAEYAMAGAYLSLRQAMGLMPTGTELK
jgi:outer membrane protein TolC